MDVSIHRLAPQDLKWVLEIENLSFNDPWTKEMFEGEIKNNDFYVVKDGEKIIGYGGFSMVLSDAFLLNLAVSPPYRRKGIGGFLLGHLITRAKEKNSKTMSLEVRRSNISAREFYYKHGFREKGIRKDYYKKGEDAVIMERNL